MKCKCKKKCKYRLDIKLEMEKKEDVKLTIWRKGIFGVRGSIIVNRKQLRDALEKEGGGMNDRR